MTFGNLILTLFCAHTAFAAITDREEWDKRFYNLPGPPVIGPGAAPGPIAALPGRQFLIGGNFTNLADTPLLNLARWDGSSWRKPFAPADSTNDHSGEIRSSGIYAIATREINPQGSFEVL